jgi:hypothetical protein
MPWALRGQIHIASCVIAAIALHAIAPAFAAASATLGRDLAVFAQICTAQGVRPVAPQAQLDDGAGAAGHVSPDCPLCRLHACGAPLPDARCAVEAPLALRVAPPRFLAAHDSLFVWAARRSRGPPASA